MIFFEKTLLFQKNKNLTHPRYTVNDYMGICVYSIDKIIGKNTNIIPVSSSYAQNHVKTFFLKTTDLIKPIVFIDISWSAGMIANLLFSTKNIYKKKNLNAQNVRRDWGLWKYIITLWMSQSTYFLLKLSPFSIRTRRFLKSLNIQSLFLIITYSWESYRTPKRSIKRWLKKKYTTQSWR